MKRRNKVLVVVLALTLLFTLMSAAFAAHSCSYKKVDSYQIGSDTFTCSSHSDCSLTIREYRATYECIYCGDVYSRVYSTSSHRSTN